MRVTAPITPITPGLRHAQSLLRRFLDVKSLIYNAVRVPAIFSMLST